MTLDETYRLLFFIAWPAAVLYPLVYGFGFAWHRSFLGRIIVAKAAGAGLLVTAFCLYFAFGPDYYGRHVFRIVGISAFLLGTWGALIAVTYRLIAGDPGDDADPDS